MNNGEKECTKEPKFSELEQNKQIEKLHYELTIVLRTISNIGNKVTVMQSHQHGRDGKMLIDMERHSRIFQADRSGRLD